MGRPPISGGRRSCKSYTLEDDVVDFVKAYGGTNQSGFLNDFIKANMHKRHELNQLEIKRLTKEIIKEQAELQEKIAVRDMLQAEDNLWVEKRGEKEDLRPLLLAKYWSCLRANRERGEFLFRGWLTGPANVRIIKDCGFGSEEEAIAWCKAQASSSKPIDHF